MCGICGICVPDGQPPPDREVLKRATDAMSHRGPDADGHWIEGNVGLGHRRLSIIDLAGGDQPMYNEDHTVVVVFNGEIYNYVELRPGLLERGHRLATVSDTEVIAHLYEERGPDCVEPLNGMFAIALWDTKNRRLLLARDRMGEKPLYYHLAGGTIVFASELKALLRFPQVKAEVDPQALDDYLAYGYVPADRCILKGVRKLPPGHRLIWQDGEARVERYWDVSFAPAPVRDETEWLQELDDRLRTSVRIRLRSDVPLGVFLSGGVDSSAIVALAAQEINGRLKTFSIGFREADFDELQYARVVAKRFDTDHHEMVVQDQDASILPKLVYHLDEPAADPSALPTYYVCREARRHVTVCVSGDGGDEVFAGYTRYQDALRYETFDGWAGPLGLGALSGALSRALPRYVRGQGALARLGAHGADRWFLQTGKFFPEERRELLQPEVLAALQEKPWLYEPYFNGHGGPDLLSRIQHADQKTYLPDDVLVKVDRMAMQNSLEVRVPFLDHTLVEFLNAAPASVKLQGERTKLPLRRLLERYLPREFHARAKRGFGIPIRDWFRGRLTDEVRGVLLAPDSRSRRFLRPEAISQLLDDEARGGRDLSRKIWALLVFEHWCREFHIG
jgi:asparagine synthase (glutamine-hydrolysing)